LYHAPSQCRIQARTQHQPPSRAAAQPGHVHHRGRPRGDHHRQGQGCASTRGKDDHLGKKGDLHSRRQALSFLTTDKAVTRLFETVSPRYGDRNGGYLRIVRTGFQQGDGAEKAFIELLGAEKQLEVKRQKREDLKTKKRAELEKQLEEQKKEEPPAEAA
jgi:hypothetical protein